MKRKLVRLLSLVSLWAALAFLAPPSVQVVHASGFCQCSGYVYAYDYYPVYYTYEGEQSWGGEDYTENDGVCFNECLNYALDTVGVGLCNTYNLGGGKGFVEPDFNWNWDGTYGGHYWQHQWSC